MQQAFRSRAERHMSDLCCACFVSAPYSNSNERTMGGYESGDAPAASPLVLEERLGEDMADERRTNGLKSRSENGREAWKNLLR